MFFYPENTIAILLFQLLNHNFQLNFHFIFNSPKFCSIYFLVAMKQMCVFIDS